MIGLLSSLSALLLLTSAGANAVSSQSQKIDYRLNKNIHQLSKPKITTPVSFYGHHEGIISDFDNDRIPDDLEKNGYTVMSKKVVPWKDEYKAQGYVKYKPDWRDAYTTGDPYTDLEKVLGRIDPSASIEAHNPLVAAAPSVGVQMEN